MIPMPALMSSCAGYVGLQERQKFINREVCCFENLVQCPRTNGFVVGNNDSRAWLVAPQNHMASTLTRKNESHTLQRLSKVLAGYVGRELGHYVGTWSSTNSFPASLGTGSPAARQSSM